jgi:paraquat-inducible protein A
MQAVDDHHVNLSDLIACHECDLLQRLPPMRAGSVAYCRRCGGKLYRERSDSGTDRALALTLGALILFIIANLYPIVGLEIQGNHQRASLYDTLHTLWSEGREDVALLVGFTTMLTPALEISLLLMVLLPLRIDRITYSTVSVLRLLQTIKPWSMMEVFLLGVLVSLVKLEHLAHLETGVALWAFGGLIPLLIAASGSFNPDEVWTRIKLNG